MKSVSLSNNELAVIAEGLKHYPYLHTMDLSDNRLEGKEAGRSIARIIVRQTNMEGGYQVNTLLLANNKVGTDGFTRICKALALRNQVYLQKLDLANNHIDDVKINFKSDKHYTQLTHLCLDGNKFRSTSYTRLSNLLWHSQQLVKISLRNCFLADSACEHLMVPISCNKKLKTVDLSNNEITNRGLNEMST